MSIVADTSQFAGPLPAGLAQPGVRQWAQRVAEKVRVAVAGGLRFFPQVDRYTEETSEIRQAYRLMLRDPVLRSAHDYKVQGVSSLDWNVIPTSSTPAGPAERDEEVAEFWRHCLRRVEGGTPAVVDAVAAGALVDGFSVSNWSAEEEAEGDFAGKLVLDRVKPKDTRYLQLMTDEFRNVTGVRAGTYNGGHVYRPDADNLLVYSHSSLFASPSGTSDHRAAYAAWWVKDVVMKLWALHLDKWVSPALKGTYSDYPQKLALEEALENLRADGWLTVPVGATVEALQIATRGEAEFQAALEYYDKQMLIGVLGAYLPVLEGKIPDGRGDTQVSKSVIDLKLWALVAAVQNVVNRQLVAPLTRLNYAGVRPPLVTLGAVSEQEMLTYLQVDDGLAKLGFKQDGKDIAARYNRKQSTDPSDALTPAGGGDQPSQGMRERFRRFAEWERYCGGQGGTPGPCATGGGGAGAGKAKTPAPKKPKASPAPAAKSAPKAGAKPSAAKKPADVKVKAAADKVAAINKKVDAAKQKLAALKGQLKAAKADHAAVKASVKGNLARPAGGGPTKADAQAVQAATKAKAVVDEAANRAAQATTLEQSGKVDVEKVKADVRAAVGKASPHKVAAAMGMKRKFANSAEAMKAIEATAVSRVGAVERTLT